MAEKIKKNPEKIVSVIYKKMGDVENMKKAILGLKETKRSYMTTVSEFDVDKLISEAENA